MSGQYRLYRSSADGGTWTIHRHVRGKGWRRWGHADHVIADVVTFHVTESGRYYIEAVWVLVVETSAAWRSSGHQITEIVANGVEIRYKSASENSPAKFLEFLSGEEVTRGISLALLHDGSMFLKPYRPEPAGGSFIEQVMAETGVGFGSEGRRRP